MLFGSSSGFYFLLYNVWNLSPFSRPLYSSALPTEAARPPRFLLFLFLSTVREIDVIFKNVGISADIFQICQH